MQSDRRADLCVIGAGAAGLSVAAGAALVGLDVVLVERDRMGGECLNTGCVPSKALLAAACTVQAIRDAGTFGIEAVPTVDFRRVHAHVRSVIDAIAPHDSVERFEGFGVHVMQGEARFLDRCTIAVDGQVIRARRSVIATGSEPAVPAVPGLDQVPFFTNETIFDNDVLPQHLIILGGGAVGVELAQAHRRLGAAVTILERDKALPHDDPELARMLLRRLEAEGITLREGVAVQAVAHDGTEIGVTVSEGGRTTRISGSHLLVATGRRPRTGGLGLEAAGVAHDDHGVTADRHLRTTARGIYAAGDVVDGPRFTHVCSHHAGIVIRNAVFRMRAAVDHRALPWVTYTDPELAQVGMTEDRARQVHGQDIRVIRVPYDESDRAHTERRTDGMLKLMADRRGRVLGASILGAHAGELAHLWVVAIEQRLRLRDLALTFAPYPTWGELNKSAALAFSMPMLTHRLVRAAARILSRLP